MLVLIAIVAIIFLVSILTAKPDKGVMILSPKANDVVKAEDSYEVLWKSEPAESEFGGMVTVEFSKDGGSRGRTLGKMCPILGSIFGRFLRWIRNIVRYGFFPS